MAIGAVDQHHVAEVARTRVPGVVEVPVLDDHGDVVDAVIVRERLGGRGYRIVEDEHPGHTPVDVIPGLAVGGAGGTRVSPQADLPSRLPIVAGIDNLMRAAVHAGRQVHAVPMHRSGLIEAVMKVDQDMLTAFGAQGGPRNAP